MTATKPAKPRRADWLSSAAEQAHLTAMLRRQSYLGQEEIAAAKERLLSQWDPHFIVNTDRYGAGRH